MSKQKHAWDFPGSQEALSIAVRCTVVGPRDRDGKVPVVFPVDVKFGRGRWIEPGTEVSLDWWRVYPIGPVARALHTWSSMLTLDEIKRIVELFR